MVRGAMTKMLLKIKGFSDTKVEKVKEAARKCMVRLVDVLPLAYDADARPSRTAAAS